MRTPGADRAPSEPLPALRPELDLMPSPLPERPGLLIRDPLGYTESVLIVPPPLVPLLRFFHGDSTELELRQELARATGSVLVGDVLRALVATLGSAGFLLNDAFLERREQARRAFAAASVREPTHTGPGGYPAEPERLGPVLDAYFDSSASPGAGGGSGAPASGAAEDDGLLAIAAPHVSPEGGFRSYAAAYAALREEHRERVLVILGTSHYGAPERFGITRKPFRTPYGAAVVAEPIVAALERAAPEAVTREDYCHKVEHSIEFQVVFLQHVLGPNLRIVPILVGPFAKSLLEGGAPEDDLGVRRFLEALAELHAREGRRLLWVLGIDMAHVGRRYGDRFRARAHEGGLAGVAERDGARIERALAGDAAGFWELVARDQDDLRWCGAAPLYTFLRAVAPRAGRLLRYEQWNIDAESVVSFAGLSFA